MTFTKCFKMSVDESQWTHGFYVNWCDHFILNFKNRLVLPVFSTSPPPLPRPRSDVAFTASTDEFCIFINSLLIGERVSAF